MIKRAILFLMLSISFVCSEGEYLEVRETGVIDDPVEVCLQVESMASASNILKEVVADYFDGIEYSARHIQNNHGFISKPCIATPMQSARKTVLVYVSETPLYGQHEFIRVICMNEADVDDKAKKIKQKWFKDKETKTKIKL